MADSADEKEGRQMQTPTRTQLFLCALLFWACALVRGAGPRGLWAEGQAGLRAGRQWLHSAANSGLTLRVTALGGGLGADGDGLHIGALLRLNGHVVQELAPRPRRDGVLELPLPRGGGGLLEISVAALNGAACVTAAGSELRWLGDEAARDALALVVRLTPLAVPLCR
jgi:hypothetical protein